ncbi:hypothetical protein JK635_02455 [Neobacillus sp. YIM B02564]|uniref:Uncharacterized protein n=1 Tax=Neobacillus paridis TaxID=2803862 RepID=A0ABS1TIK9_9BACI|nr:hypothetical protein [Neobacillus paridis]MBL4951102.1 hypothetical protein [Neobacillus paridis]
MEELTIKNLEACFKNAKVLKQNFVAVRIEMEGFPKAEIIVNPIENADSKLAYYQKTYNENLNHKYAKGIKIVGFTFGEDMKEIQEDLAY